MSDQTAIALQPIGHPEALELTVTEIVAKVAKVREVAQEVMKKDIHFGLIPGTPKPTLYKPGGEILGLTFRLSPRYEGEREPVDLGNGHREYVVRCDLYHIHSGLFYGSGVGSCSTMEAKYRYGTGPKEFTDKPVPKEYWEVRNSDPTKAKQIIGGAGYTVGKNDEGNWVICRQGERIEHDNPADYYNTTLKMAAKRAYIDAILKATAASEVYTQDVEDSPRNEEPSADDNASEPKPDIQQPKRKSESAETPPSQENGLITEGQVKRMWAKTYAHDNLTLDQQKELMAGILQHFGYKSSKDVKKIHYDAIIKAIEAGKVPEVHADPDPKA